MKLLFDENLSRRLVRLLVDLYPASAHVTSVGLERADERAAQLEEGAVALLRQRQPDGAQMRQHVLEVAPHVVRQEEAVVQRLAP